MTFIVEWYRVEESRQTVIGSLSKHDVDGSESVIWKCNFAFLQSFFTYFKVIILEKCVQAILEIGPSAWDIRGQLLSSYAHVVHTTAKQVISRRRMNEKFFKMTKDEKCTCKASKNTVFHCQICKFDGFLLPSSSWLLKLPNNSKTWLTDKKCKEKKMTITVWKIQIWYI